ncbi:hypothetical protein [Sphingopyxis macrogoltabida]|nr:hypothetical protein [Sphingopyxis macrogoltabida]
MIDGHDGVAVTGRADAYATALWLEGPSAFWLHPEGPLSDTTPDEWREKQSRAVGVRIENCFIENSGERVVRF